MFSSLGGIEVYLPRSFHSQSQLYILCTPFSNRSMFAMNSLFSESIFNIYVYTPASGSDSLYLKYGDTNSL